MKLPSKKIISMFFLILLSLFFILALFPSLISLIDHEVDLIYFRDYAIGIKIDNHVFSTMMRNKCVFSVVYFDILFSVCLPSFIFIVLKKKMASIQNSSPSKSLNWSKIIWLFDLFIIGVFFGSYWIFLTEIHIFIPLDFVNRIFKFTFPDFYFNSHILWYLLRVGWLILTVLDIFLAIRLWKMKRQRIHPTVLQEHKQLIENHQSAIRQMTGNPSKAETMNRREE